jgi:putative PIN family toxin of toxin-antitoxin system
LNASEPGNGKRMRIVADTNILISSVLCNGPSCEVMLYAVRREIELCISNRILAEFSKVMADPKERLCYSPQEIYDMIGVISSFAKIVDPGLIKPVTRDPKDDHVIACALASKADYIVTYDNDLLVLNEYNGIKIVKPEEFLVVMSK